MPRHCSGQRPAYIIPPTGKTGAAADRAAARWLDPEVPVRMTSLLPAVPLLFVSGSRLVADVVGIFAYIPENRLGKGAVAVIRTAEL